MTFWNLSDGEDLSKSKDTEFETGGGNFDPIPNNTQVLAAPDEVKWRADTADIEYLEIRWSVLAPEQYRNRKVFQKLWVTADDPRAKDPEKKRDKAKRMLAAIDANAGGKLKKITKKPTDDELSLALCNKPMMLKLMVWEMEADNGEMNRGNWISSVAPRGSAQKAAEAETVEEDEIPF